ncbi:hypothetical protein DFA_07093 [Cavenderia fasciculata]|uniref:Methyltransferase domain-containing protein n=1 Tax=Cavenderia fasciculata TaxID=261658 RepID=F4PVG5_CACFS|nr:uncharacterized protein DFA_07093 [Cavenderia fasciculata]EGG19979.1 hypothetical protein DFA_07093 [Cavenderia fasciculata]|eukprot:XP_004366962.1 hypothetical protein DFA_07093 [Cavenderia fasciculata]
MIPREHILEDINKQQRQQKKDNHHYSNNKIIQQHLGQQQQQTTKMKQTLSTTTTTSTPSAGSNSTKMTFEEEFPLLSAATNNNKKKNKSIGSTSTSTTTTTSRSSSPSNSHQGYNNNNIQYQQPPQQQQPSSPPQPVRSQYISKYIDVSDGDESTSWKKRDLLYYCFIQRHHEVTTIANFVEGAAQLYGLTSDITLLDIGCGLGRMFGEWDRRKVFKHVDAMEPDLDYWTFASDHAMNTSDKVTAIHGGFMDVSVKNKYKMCVSVHGPFQYLLRLEDKLEALRRIWISLQPGGVVLLDVSNFLVGLSQLRNQTEQKVLVNGIPVKRISNIEVDFHNSIWRLQDLFFSVDSPMDPDEIGNGYGDGQYVCENHQFAIYTLPELQLLLASCGFQNIRSTSKYCIQDLYQGSISDGPRIIVLAQKPTNSSNQS